MCSTVSERAVAPVHHRDLKRFQRVTICDSVFVATDGCGGAVVVVAVATVVVVVGQRFSIV